MILTCKLFWNILFWCMMIGIILMMILLWINNNQAARAGSWLVEIFLMKSWLDCLLIGCFFKILGISIFRITKFWIEKPCIFNWSPSNLLLLPTHEEQFFESSPSLLLRLASQHSSRFTSFLKNTVRRTQLQRTALGRQARFRARADTAGTELVWAGLVQRAGRVLASGPARKLSSSQLRTVVCLLNDRRQGYYELGRLGHGSQTLVQPSKYVPPVTSKVAQCRMSSGGGAAGIGTVVLPLACFFSRHPSSTKLCVENRREKVEWVRYYYVCTELLLLF